jgi:hypothetical protein
MTVEPQASDSYENLITTWTDVMTYKGHNNLVPKYFWLSHSFYTEAIKKFAIMLFLS